MEDDPTIPQPKIRPPRALGVVMEDDPTVPQPKIKISISGRPGTGLDSGSPGKRLSPN
jgi:hypothetical protein